MKISVHVKPNSRVNAVEPIDATHFVVRVSAKPHDGKANEAIIRTLSEYLHIPQSRIIIAKGAKNRIKLISIE